MQDGDLAVTVRPRNVVVLEGVLATVIPVVQHRRLREDVVTGYHFHWHEVPMKRCWYNKTKYPDYALDIVTFVSEEATEDAAQFLMSINFPHDTIEYHDFRHWTSYLSYQSDVQVVYDSDQERLDHYGQLGRSVIQGGDF